MIYVRDVVGFRFGGKCGCEMSGGLGHKDVRGNSITDKMNMLCAWWCWFWIWLLICCLFDWGMDGIWQQNVVDEWKNGGKVEMVLGNVVAAFAPFFRERDIWEWY